MSRGGGGDLSNRATGRGLICLTGVLAVALVLPIVSCSSTAPPDRVAYTTIDDAVTGVQAAVRGYKLHCGVPQGAQGPGTCTSVEYEKAIKAYKAFQDVADSAVDLASKGGPTPLDIVAKAAQAAISVLRDLK